jgi:type I restriction enzyme R subunit
LGHPPPKAPRVPRFPLAASLKLLDQLDAEAKRHARQRLSEDELAVFDLLTQPDPVLPAHKRDRIKRVAGTLLDKLRPCPP